MPLPYYKSCDICGAFFHPTNNRQILCGDKECKRQHQKEYKRYNKQGKKTQHKVMLGLTKDAIAANNLGLTYGQYKAKQWIRNKQR